MSLRLPRPSSASSSAPPTPTAPAATGDVIMSPPTQATRLPPRNFASSSTSTSTSHSAHALARSAARDLRASTKSPFVPKKKAASPLGASNGTGGGHSGGGGAGNGKERDLSALSIEDLEDMLLRNKEVLESPTTLSLLPGGSTKLLASQTRIAARLNELKQMRRIRDDMERTHLEEKSSVKLENEEEDVKPIKSEDGEVKMEDVTDVSHATDPAELATSPLTKKRLASRPSGPQSPHSLTSTISLSESIALQQAAVNRQREAARRREEKQAAIERSMGGGGRLRGAMGESKVGEFIFHPDSDDSDADSDVDLDFLSSSKLSLGGSGLATSSSTTAGGAPAEFSLSGQLDDEEDSQLNPYRVAYESGWERANEEMESDIKAGGGREVRP